MHNGGLDVNCHLEQFRKMIEAHRPNAVLHHGSRVIPVQGEQREPSETFSSSPYMGSIGKYAGAFSLIQPLRNI